ncbi:hypothetical protein [Helicobacter sp. MIT 14-3879]|uniref:hypothetical protein n=1 Tax=Helicobacter sp. MIT 14-3879 TaxID=2040649 RepID=UPI00216309A9|nr:hypothetical protein [Helicobacter sp. MIT 14-3879]
MNIITTQDKLKEYIKNIRDISKDFINENSEFSFRTYLENLINNIKPKEVKLIHEAREEQGIRPDFKVYKHIDSNNMLSYNALLGFI